MLTNCSECVYLFDRSVTNPHVLHAKSLQYRFACRRRAPVMAVDANGDEVWPHPTVDRETGGCGEGETSVVKQERQRDPADQYVAPGEVQDPPAWNAND